MSTANIEERLEKEIKETWDRLHRGIDPNVIPLPTHIGKAMFAAGFLLGCSDFYGEKIKNKKTRSSIKGVKGKRK